MAKWKLTVRHGSDVSHESYGDLGEAVAAMRRRALDIRSEGPLGRASFVREYEPGDQVGARLQLSSGGLFGRRVAGVDVRGDGTFLPYRGGMRREELDPTDYDTPFDAVRETLES